jgi:hypothetical protein
MLGPKRAEHFAPRARPHRDLPLHPAVGVAVAHPEPGRPVDEDPVPIGELGLRQRQVVGWAPPVGREARLEASDDVLQWTPVDRQELGAPGHLASLRVVVHEVGSSPDEAHTEGKEPAGGHDRPNAAQRSAQTGVSASDCRHQGGSFDEQV